LCSLLRSARLIFVFTLDGNGKATFHALTTYATVLSGGDRLQIIGNALKLALYFTIIPLAWN
jgi:hypothetical protein